MLIELGRGNPARARTTVVHRRESRKRAFAFAILACSRSPFSGPRSRISCTSDSLFFSFVMLCTGLVSIQGLWAEIWKERFAQHLRPSQSREVALWTLWSTKDEDTATQTSSTAFVTVWSRTWRALATASRSTGSREHNHRWAQFGDVGQESSPRLTAWRIRQTDKRPPRWRELAEWRKLFWKLFSRNHAFQQRVSLASSLRHSKELTFVCPFSCTPTSRSASGRVYRNFGLRDFDVSGGLVYNRSSDPSWLCLRRYHLHSWIKVMPNLVLVTGGSGQLQSATSKSPV